MKIIARSKLGRNGGGVWVEIRGKHKLVSMKWVKERLDWVENLDQLRRRRDKLSPDKR